MLRASPWGCAARWPAIPTRRLYCSAWVWTTITGASVAVILLGLGLDEFSMSSIGIPEIKRIIRSVTVAEAEELVGTIMEMKSYREIDAHVRAWVEGRFAFISAY